MLKAFLTSKGVLKKCRIFIIGVQKGGTTQLFNLLNIHQDIIGSRIKETHFFSSDHKFKTRGYRWYADQFPGIISWNSESLMEATPSYIFNPLALKRIQDYNPRANLILLLRNPVDRAYSAWNMFSTVYRREGMDQRLVENRSFEEAIDEEIQDIDLLTKHSYIRRGIYADQLESLLKIVDRERIIVIRSEQFWTEPQEILDNIFSFLGITSFSENLDMMKIQGAGEYKNKITSNVRKRLVNFYRPHNDRLYSLLGEKYPW